MEHICNVCNKVYSSYNSLWNHNKRFHTQNTTILCIYCNKCFSRNDNLKRHQLKCYKKIENELYKQQIEKLKHTINKKNTNKIINYNTVNNNNNNNNNNLININNIGTEKISDLTRDEKKYIMSRGMNSIISLAEHLNFNEKLPQNHKHLNAIDNNTHAIVKQQKKEIFDQILVAHIDKLGQINHNIIYKDFNNVLQSCFAQLLIGY